MKDYSRFSDGRDENAIREQLLLSLHWSAIAQVTGWGER